jgi:hypothetical protein
MISLPKAKTSQQQPLFMRKLSADREAEVRCREGIQASGLGRQEAAVSFRQPSLIATEQRASYLGSLIFRESIPQLLYCSGLYGFFLSFNLH